MHNIFRLRLHFMSLSLNQPLREILKTFLKMVKRFNAEILTTLKTIKYASLNTYKKLFMEREN